MRLLATDTLELHEYFGEDTPPYAILSHRWEEGEVSYHDLRDGRGSQMKGWSKIVGCCKQANKRWKFVWIDTCCIDKTSSAELSESINSMFQWYMNAQVCFAYLSDVESAEEDPFFVESAFRRSAWFKRGWTLQELLAPKWVEFYDSRWVEIGTKSSLQEVIQNVTRITHLFNHRDASVAQKMSWASSRHTTRKEDEAYCLMGLFNVNMPLLYGEGSKAFYRLQLEILSQSGDDSLFAWQEPIQWRLPGGLLAEKPQQFKDCGDIVVSPVTDAREPPTMTSKGIRLEVFHTPDYAESTGPTELHAHLNCIRKSRLDMSNSVSSDFVLGLLLYWNPTSNSWNRSRALQEVPHPMKLQDPKTKKPALATTIIYVPQRFEIPRQWDPRNFLIKTAALLKVGFVFFNHFSTPAYQWQVGAAYGVDPVLSTRGHIEGRGYTRAWKRITENLGTLTFVRDRSELLVLVIAADERGNRIDLVVTDEAEPSSEKLRSLLYAEGQSIIEQDRVFTLLEDGMYVHASLRRGMDNLGFIGLIVDLEVNFQPGLSWHKSVLQPILFPEEEWVLD